MKTKILEICKFGLVIIAMSGIFYKAAAHGVNKCRATSINYDAKRDCLGL